MEQQRLAGLQVGLMLVGLCSAGHVGFLTPAVYAENASAGVSVSDGQEAARLLGSSDAKKYHTPSCKWVKRITTDNRVEFASEADAKKSGYTPCKTCFSSGKANHAHHVKKSTTVAQSQERVD